MHRTTLPTDAATVPDAVSFLAGTVTGSQELPVEFGARLPVRAVADSLAHRMSLPGDVAWALRDDRSSQYLDDDRPIGDQVEPGSHVTITPKTHLGGGVGPRV